MGYYNVYIEEESITRTPLCQLISNFNHGCMSMGEFDIRARKILTIIKLNRSHKKKLEVLENKLRSAPKNPHAILGEIDKIVDRIRDLDGRMEECASG